jgi:hypothetical protein
MTQSDATPDPAQPSFAVVFEGGQTLTCPAQPQPCAWVAIAVDGVEIHRLNADALQANPGVELTRLAEALIPGLPETPGLPRPEENEEQEWHECAIAVAANGNTIRFDAPPEAIESVRVCEPNGALVGYWEEEFDSDAVDALGDVIDALSAGDRSPAPGSPADD